MRLGVAITGQGEAFRGGAGESSRAADYRLKFVSQSGSTYEGLSSQGNLAVVRSSLQGYELVKNQQGKAWSIGEQGFRAESKLAPQKAPNEFRVFLLGGSTAFGQLSSSDQTTIAQELETKLNWRVNQQQKQPNQFRPQQLPYFADEQSKALAKPKRIPEKRYQVINAAVPGYASSNELVHLVRHVLSYQPDVIVLLNGYTDLVLPSDQVAVEVPKIESLLDNAWAHFSTSKRQQIGNFLNNFYLIKGLNRWILKPEQSGSVSLPPGFESKAAHIPTNGEELTRRIDRYEENLRKIAQISGVTQAPLLVALQPKVSDRLKAKPTEKEAQILKQLGNDYPKRTEAAYTQLRSSVENVKKAFPQRVFSLNLENIFQSTEGEVFQDSIHLTDSANQILAEQLYGAIVQRLEIEAKPYSGLPPQ